jgi:hypothetical protein
MTGLVVWALRLLVLYVIVRILMSALGKMGLHFKGRPKEQAKRFDARDKKVVDADFEEL